MPALKNPRHERFCVEYSRDHNATQAATRAGYSDHTAGQQGHRLLKNAQISSRIAELDTAVTKSVLDSAEDVLRDAIATYRAAHADGQYGAAVSALNLRAKRYAEFSEKHEVKAEIDQVTRHYIGIEVREV